MPLLKQAVPRSGASYTPDAFTILLSAVVLDVVTVAAFLLKVPGIVVGVLFRIFGFRPFRRLFLFP